jgi:hypothetical protein
VWIIKVGKEISIKNKIIPESYNCTVFEWINEDGGIYCQENIYFLVDPTQKKEAA